MMFCDSSKVIAGGRSTRWMKKTGWKPILLFTKP